MDKLSHQLGLPEDELVINLDLSLDSLFFITSSTANGPVIDGCGREATWKIYKRVFKTLRH